MIFKKSIPLYVQIKELLINKINNKEWLPGDAIPSEIALAKSLNVSLGTIRKAIEELVNNNILDRKQGKGTFVKTHDMYRALFHFFHLVSKNGDKVIPHSKILSLTKRLPTTQELDKLQLTNGEKVINILRTRDLEDQTIILETIILPYKIFKQLLHLDPSEIPNTLYEFYETYFEITVHTAQEKISALAASKADSKIIGIPESYPLLRIERIAFTLNKKPIELRISKCNTQNHYYDNTVL